jgi:D-alanyl-D-alanine carboxypeptidase
MASLSSARAHLRRLTVCLLALSVIGSACAYTTAVPPALEPAIEANEVSPSDPWSGELSIPGVMFVEPPPADRAVEAEPAASTNNEVAALVTGPVPAAWAAAPERTGRSEPPEISALAAIVLDEASAGVLYEKNAREMLPPASLTKIVTAVLALERGDPDAWVDIDVDGQNMPRSTVMGIVPGDRFRLRDLLYGLMLPSGNDAALAIGRHISGSDEAFVAEMNALAPRLGLGESHFANPHGLGSPGHAASAYDLAMFSRYAMMVPGFADIVRAPVWTAQGSRTLSFGNINRFLFNYQGADGIKTGYTRSAGQTLVASATRQGQRLYVVVMNAPARDSDARRLLDWAFSEYRWPGGGQQ